MNFLTKLNQTPEQIEFVDTIALIDTLYSFTPTRFQNGKWINDVNENHGSCKLFSFAKLQNLSESQTLACFGTYYRDDVLKHPDNSNHQNIRHFIQTGWDGIHFATSALVEK